MDLQTTYEAMKQNFLNTARGLTDEVQQCIDICLLCHKTCEEMLPYCLQKGGVHSETQHVLGLLTCAEICRTTAHFMMWSSLLNDRLCAICAEICHQCADDCDELSEDKMMKMCSEICRRCAESCQKMAEMY